MAVLTGDLRSTAVSLTSGDAKLVAQCKLSTQTVAILKSWGST